MVNVTQTDVSVDHVAASAPPPSLLLERGASVGRYVILDVVGEGGMGIVYAAYDPELDRKLALKLLRTASSERRAERRRMRLIREAQAMARLSHVNVITVHDVGTIDDQVFVAMEFIEGCSLAEWIREDHDWRIVVEVFMQAGSGLAAAHAAGLVHRDFKPDNVMLTTEHRAVVTDFGLARAASGTDGAQGREPERLRGPSRASLSTTVTAAGAIMGTPAYMSPEQHEGREVDARSDQFAFAVASYEALYGMRPFPGEDISSLSYNVGAGNVRPAPARSAVPTWLRGVLLRALSVEPSERYPSMVDLLGALRRDRGAARRWPWKVVALAAGGGLAVAGGMWLDEDDPCASGASGADAVLVGAARRPVERAFSESSLPFALDGWTALDAALDDYEASWRDTYGLVCAGGGSVPKGVQASRIACLQRSLTEVDSLLGVIADGDVRAVGRALEAVVDLPPPQRCQSVPASPLPPPQLREMLGSVAALARAGMHEEGTLAARELLERTSSTEHVGLHAEARVWLAAMQRERGRRELAEYNLEEALGLALRAQRDDVAANAAVALVDTIGADPQRAREAEAWAGVAAALQDRASASPGERATLLIARAGLLEASARFDAARRPLREAAELLEEAYGVDDVRIAATWTEVGRHALRAFEPQDARAAFERALPAIEASLGPAHPRAGMLRRELGRVAMLEGDLAGAADALRRAGDILQHDPDVSSWTETMLLRADVDMSRGELEAARRTLDALGAHADLPSGVSDRVAAGIARLALRNDDVLGAARSIEVVRGGGEVDVVRADVARRQGQLAWAETLVDRALEQLLRERGDDAPGLAEPLTVRGQLLLQRDLAARALGDLERALALRSAGDPFGSARTEFALARALVAVDPSSTRAPKLARRALGRLSVREPLYATIQRWLAATQTSEPRP